MPPLRAVRAAEAARRLCLVFRVSGRLQCGNHSLQWLNVEGCELDSRNTHGLPGPRTGVQTVSVKRLSMEKWLCWGSMGVAGFLLLLFRPCLALPFPFGGLSPV